MIHMHKKRNCCEWDDRLAAILRYSFYLGYRYGQSLIEAVDDPALYKNVGKTLMTEYELGIIMTQQAREEISDSLKNIVLDSE